MAERKDRGIDRKKRRKREVSETGDTPHVFDVLGGEFRDRVDRRARESAPTLPSSDNTQEHINDVGQKCEAQAPGGDAEAYGRPLWMVDDTLYYKKEDGSFARLFPGQADDFFESGQPIRLQWNAAARSLDPVPPQVASVDSTDDRQELHRLLQTVAWDDAVKADFAKQIDAADTASKLRALRKSLSGWVRKDAPQPAASSSAASADVSSPRASPTGATDPVAAPSSPRDAQIDTARAHLRMMLARVQWEEQVKDDFWERINAASTDKELRALETSLKGWIRRNATAAPLAPAAAPPSQPTTVPPGPSATPATPRPAPAAGPASAPSAPHAAAPATPAAPTAAATAAPRAFNPPPDFELSFGGAVHTAAGGRSERTGTIQPMGMDNMFERRRRADAYVKNLNTVNPATGAHMEPQEDLSLADIRGNPAEQEMFFSFLDNNDPVQAKEIADAYADKAPLTAAQDAWLEQMRAAYNVRRLEAHNVRDVLSTEDMARIAELDPRIKEVVGKIGVKRAEQLLESELVKLSLRDKNAFNQLVQTLKTEHALRNGRRAKSLEKRIRESLGEYGLTEDDFIQGTTAASDAERRKKLAEMAQPHLPPFFRAIDFGNWISGRRAKELIFHYKDQQTLLAQSDNHLRSIGRVLQLTLTPEVKAGIEKYMYEGTLETRPEGLITTPEQYREFKQSADDSAVEKRWDAYKKAEAGRLNIKNNDWSSPTNSATLDAMKEAFAQKEFNRQRNPKASSLFAKLLAALFPTLKTKDDIKNHLK